VRYWSKGQARFAAGLSKHDLVRAGTDRDRGEPRRTVDEPQLEVEIAQPRAQRMLVSGDLDPGDPCRHQAVVSLRLPRVQVSGTAPLDEDWSSPGFEDT
jgi:hypothetical protein